MENYYAKSPVLGRVSRGSFYGLKYKNKSKHYRVRIYCVCRQTWVVDIIDEESDKVFDILMLRQAEEKTPYFELSDSPVYKHGYHWKSTACEIEEL